MIVGTPSGRCSTSTLPEGPGQPPLIQSRDRVSEDPGVERTVTFVAGTIINHRTRAVGCLESCRSLAVEPDPGWD